MKYSWSKDVLKVRLLEEQVDLLHRELLQHHSQHFIPRRRSKPRFPCFSFETLSLTQKANVLGSCFCPCPVPSLPQDRTGALLLRVACFLMAAWSPGNVVYSKTCLDREHELWGIRTSGCCCFGFFFFYFFLNTLVAREPQGISASTLEVGGLLCKVCLAVQIGLHADTGMHRTARE